MAIAKVAKMANSTALAIPGMPGSSKEDEAALTAPRESSGGLAILSLMQSVSDPVKKNQPSGIRAGDYLLGRNDILKTVRAVVGVSRPRAVYIDSGEVQSESYDTKSAEWEKIVALKKHGKNGARYGLEFLLWLPDHGQFAQLGFFNTARERGADMIAARDAKKMVTLSAELVDGKSFSWHLPVVDQVENPGAVAMPSAEQTEAALAFFEAYKQQQQTQTQAGGELPF